ncbi:MAG: YidC/Oxa1 family membrane protein insertase, partial [Sediminicola sp.]
MEEKKFDVKSIIGFVLIFGILIFMFYQNQPTPEELEAQKAKQEQVEAQSKVAESTKEIKTVETGVNLQDSTSVAGYKNAVGAFGFNSPSDATTVLENDLVVLKVSNKGGQIVEARMKNFVTYDSIPVYLVKDGNASFDIMFKTNENRS